MFLTDFDLFLTDFNRHLADFRPTWGSSTFVDQYQIELQPINENDAPLQGGQIFFSYSQGEINCDQTYSFTGNQLSILSFEECNPVPVSE